MNFFFFGDKMKSKDDDREYEYKKEKIDKYIIEFEVSLANMEKVGVAFLVAGYSNYIYATNLDILDAQNRNNTGKTSEEAFLFSQKLVLLGYILLWIVALRRTYVKELSNIYRDEKNDITANQNVASSYLISIIANAMRLQAFNTLNNEEVQSKKEENDNKNNS